nr:unnamed protein product [Callosobruchus analis]
MVFLVNDCQIKWKNIRNGFVRSLKPTPSGSSTKQKKLYYLDEELQFVLPFVKPVVHTNEPGNITAPPSATEDIERNSLSEDEEPAEISQSSEMSCSQHISGTFRKPKIRKVTNEADKAFLEWVKRKETKNESSRKMFLLSMLPDIESLSEKQMREFRIKMLLLLQEIQTGSAQQPKRYTDHYSSISSVE